jgi:hypothetical protein
MNSARREKNPKKVLSGSRHWRVASRYNGKKVPITSVLISEMN